MIQKEYFDFDSIRHLEETLGEFRTKRIFLVTGRNSYYLSGADKYLSAFLNRYQIAHFCDFSSNAKAQDINKGIEVFKQSRADTVIAVGGGSVIDMAKIANFFAANQVDKVEYFTNWQNGAVKGLPLVAIPTTAGSGSEATCFGVFYIGRQKFSVDNKFILPDVAIVDPTLTASVSGYTAASAGIDALSQAIESYWSINSNDESRNYAAEAVKLIMDNLISAVSDRTASARLAMSKAANLAGKAINITRTTAPHAISYPLTSYFGIAHGHAAGLTLAEILLYNAGVNCDDVLDNRGSEYVRKTIGEIVCLLGAEDADHAGKIIKDLMRAIGLKIRLSEMGIDPGKDIETIITAAFNPERVKNNPRKLTKEALKKILRSIYE